MRLTTTSFVSTFCLKMLSLIVMFISACSLASDAPMGDRGHQRPIDQILKINWQMSPDYQCVENITVVNTPNVCSQCKNRKNCVCISKRKKITWEAEGVDFVIKFPGRPGDKVTPCTRQSDIKSRHSRAQCVIAKDGGDYYYSVKLTNECDEFDPRIVIY